MMTQWNCHTIISGSSSRAAMLQNRWQAVTERECIARLRNRKLLQDFQIAQETLSDLVARTEAMTFIRQAEYETHLEVKFPLWRQRLRNKSLTREHHKKMDQHLNICTEKMEENDDQRKASDNKPQQEQVVVNSPASISPNPCHCPFCYSPQYTSKQRDKRTEDMPVSKAYKKDEAGNVFKKDEEHQVYNSVEMTFSGIQTYFQCEKAKEEEEESPNEEDERRMVEAAEEYEKGSNASVEPSISEKRNHERQSEDEEDKKVDIKEEDEVKITATERADIEDIESRQEGMEASRSERNIDDSLKLLYKDDTEDEELNCQESQDGTDYDDVVVGNVTPCLFDPIHNDTTYQDHDDDEVEVLLAPQNNSWAEETKERKDILKDLCHDLEDELHRQNRLHESEDSYDEFDHFYD